MTTQIGAQAPPAFYDNLIEHLRMIVDYLLAAGNRANATVPKDGSEAIDMIRFGYLDQPLTGSANDLDIGGYSVVRFDLDGDYNLTGIAAEEGRFLLLVNVSASNTLTLLSEDSGSAAANQLLLSGASVAIAPDGTAILWYDPVVEKWREVKT